MLEIQQKMGSSLDLIELFWMVSKTTNLKMITYYLVEATSKEVGPTTWVRFTNNPQRKK
jgi:hypothetical protein